MRQALITLFILFAQPGICQDIKINLVLDSVQVVTGDEIYNKFDLGVSNKFRVVTLINGDCTKCIMTLQAVNALIDTVGVHNFYSFLVYVHGDDLDLFDYYNETGIKFKYPLLYDRTNSFGRNNTSAIRKDINTFLLNSENEVILSGNINNEDFFNKIIAHSKNQPQIIDSYPEYPIKSLPDSN